GVADVLLVAVPDIADHDEGDAFELPADRTDRADQAARAGVVWRDQAWPQRAREKPVDLLWRDLGHAGLAVAPEKEPPDDLVVGRRRDPYLRGHGDRCVH